MSQFVNVESADMVNKERYPLTKLGDRRQVDSGHRQLKRRAQALRAVAKIEAALKRRA